MAKLECELVGDFETIVADIEDTVMSGSLSASLEDASNLRIGECRCAVRVFERYSFMGGNRVSMNVVLLESNGNLQLSVITAGGSQAISFKVNTIGEESFLDTVRAVVEKYRR